jgi:hypothetical protein
VTENDVCLSIKEKEELCQNVMDGCPSVIAEAMYNMPEVKKCIKTLVLKNIDIQCKKLCVKTKGTPSVLRTTSESQKRLESFKWIDILHELKDRAPDILDFLVTIAIPSKLKNTGRQIPPLCTAFGILMNQRSRELSLVQKLNSVILGLGNATKKVLIHNHFQIINCQNNYRVCDLK